MTTTVRDPWTDAHRAATQVVLDPDVAAVRRRIWFRRAGGLAVLCAALLAAFLVADLLVEPSGGDDLWSLPVHALWAAEGLVVAGIVLVIAVNVRSGGRVQPLVTPAAFLPRADRAWLRRQIAEDRGVAEPRRTVVTDAARRMVVEGSQALRYLGLVLIWVGLVAVSGSGTLLVALSVAIVVGLTRAVLAAVWSRRARRWLARNA